jgi:hypothetical protein
MTLKYPAFVRQPDGITLVSDGTKTVTFDTAEMFAIACPTFVMPAGVVGINYELRGGTLLHSRQYADGSVAFSQDQDEALEDIILSVGALEAVRAEMDHPLWGKTNVEHARVIAVQRVDQFAEQIRLQYVTPGSAQAMVYQAKLAEADRWDANGNPADLTGYPLIAAEVPLTAATAADLVATWRGMQTQWLAIAAQIEATRLTAKRDIGLAADVAGVKAILDNIDWPA